MEILSLKQRQLEGRELMEDYNMEILMVNTNWN